jgi:hypothetical protein
MREQGSSESTTAVVLLYLIAARAAMTGTMSITILIA